MTKVFISATSRDLAAFHTAACEVCSKLRLEFRDMKDFPAESKGATQASLDHLDECDLYVGIFAFRYGYEEDGYKGVSVTDMEYRHAEKRGLDRLCFLAEESQWTGIKDPDLTQVKAFRDKILPKLVVSFFGDDVKDFQLKLMASLSRWKEQNPSRPGGTSADLFTDPDDVTANPRMLFGRDDLLPRINTLLDNNGRTLLHGFGGMGKTALAAHIAAQRIKDGKGSVLWLRLGSSDANALCEALARPFGAHQQIAAEVGDAHLKATRALLRHAHPGLLVLDDAWSGSALFQLLKAVPSDLPLIVTSRQTYGIDGELFDVAELPEADAIKLVEYHARRQNDPDMPALCRRLGHHAFALEIAGRTMHTRRWSAAAMLKQIKESPHELKAPLDFSDREHSSVKVLLDASLAALPDDLTRDVFLAFGAFFAPRLTPEMLKLYFVGKPEVSPEPLQIALNTLTDYGLARRIDTDDEALESFRIHDLAYSYALAQTEADDQRRALDACLIYTQNYNQPSLENFRALRPELNNFIGAATYAFTSERWMDGRVFVEVLYAGQGTGGLLPLRGFYTEALTLLKQAADSAHEHGDLQNEGNYLGNLGIAYHYLGQYDKAIEYHSQALAIAQQIGDRRVEGSILGNLGAAYDRLGQYEKAIEYHSQALAITQQIGDRRVEGNTLGNLGAAYRNVGQYEKAVEYHSQALAISRQIGDRHGEGQDLGSLGTAYFSLGQCDKALENFTQALAIAQQIGDRHGEGTHLNNLGAAYEVNADFVRALDYYQRARAVYASINGLAFEVEKVDKRIANLQAKQRGDAPSGSNDEA